MKSEYPQELEEEAYRIMQEAVRQMESQEFDEVEEILRRALKVCPIPPVMNNLAVVHLHRGEYREALAVLKPNLVSVGPNPYAHATASQCLFRLGKLDEAAAEAETAVQDFRSGRPMESGWMFRPDEAGWYEYAVPIFKALGDLDEHGRIWRLYQEWEVGIREPVAHYYAGIAAFNMGRFRQAETAWRRAKGRDWRFLQSCRFVARLCMSEGLPGPVMNYEVPNLDMDELTDAVGGGQDWERAVGWFLDNPANLMVQLRMMFSDETFPARETGIQQLVRYGGQWGEEFGRGLLLSRLISDRMRMAVISGLLERGAVDPDEPIEVLFDGELQEILPRKVEVGLSTEATPEEELLHEEIRTLMEDGELEDARRKLEEVVLRDGVTWVQLVFTYATVLRRLEEYDQAEGWFEMLEEQLPGNPLILVDFARLRLAQRRYDEVRRLLGEMEWTGISPEAREQLEDIREMLLGWVRLMESPGMLFGRSAEKRKKRAEDKPVHPTRTTLRSALRKVPVQWLDAACSLYCPGERASLRRDREEQLAEWLLQNPGRALANLTAFDPDAADDVLDLIAFLLDEGGWVEKGRVTRRFGTDEDDGFFWSEEPPVSTLGLTRMAGLVFVGRTMLSGERRTIAAIPSDLRDPLHRALAGGWE